MKTKKYIRFGLVFFIPLAFTISQCFHKAEPLVQTFDDPRGAAFAGTATCLKCHAKLTEDYLHTAHFATSAPTSAESVHGSFSPGSNSVSYDNNIKVIMEKNGDSIYQSNYVGGILIQKQPFDITFGHKQAETYLYWRGKYIFELPVSYYNRLHQWAISPGLSAKGATYNRLIGETCFECHSSYIKQIPPDENEMRAKIVGLERGSMLLGIDCERCHGGAAQHVNYQTQNPNDKTPKFITKISSLSRAQRTDLCGQCHSGINPYVISTFDFKPGDTLSHYMAPKTAAQVPDYKRIDVHGNQVGLLTASQCFVKGKIECGTCHNTHNNQVQSVKMVSLICTNCHSEAKHNFCKMAGQLGQVINSNCIDCHMPVKTSSSIVLRGTGDKINYPFIARMHRIAIYPDETKKVEAMLGGK